MGIVVAILLGVIVILVWLIYPALRPWNCERDGHRFRAEDVISGYDSPFCQCAKCGKNVNIMECK